MRRLLFLVRLVLLALLVVMAHKGRKENLANPERQVRPELPERKACQGRTDLVALLANLDLLDRKGSLVLLGHRESQGRRVRLATTLRRPQLNRLRRQRRRTTILLLPRQQLAR